MKRTSMVFSTLGAIGLLTQASFGQPLINGGFENAGAPCDPGNGWVREPSSSGNCGRDGTAHPPFGGAYEGSHYGSTDVGGPSNGASSRIYQNVTLTGAGNVRLRGAIAGAVNNGSATHYARVFNGLDTVTGTPIAEFTKPSILTWTPFDVSGTPSGNQVTVVWGYESLVNSDWNVVACHADAMVLTLQQPNCAAQPSISSVTPKFGPNTGVLANVQISGQNFDGTSQVILRRIGSADIQATNETVSGGGSTLTVSLPLSGARMGKWDVVVTKATCDEATLGGGFIVAHPALTNGSFELPTAATSCPNPPLTLGPADSWLQSGISSALDLFTRDSDQFFPDCPRPEGIHYGSIVVPAGTFMQYWRIYQYITVTPNQQISICGQFAGGGRLHTALRLFDGDENGTELAVRDIFQRDGCPGVEFKWAKACVTGTPVAGLITVEWRVGGHPRDPSVVVVGHADNLVITPGAPPAEVCNNSIDDDGDRRKDCQDEDCSAAPGCASPPVEVCGNFLDDDGDLRVDCDDTDCAAQCIEVCGNEIDDDGDCEVDEAECSQAEVCTDGIDNDGDTKVDCLDPDCVGTVACPCETPFADADGDGDVDQDDFGLVQLCVTGTLSGTPPALATTCVCYDRDGDRDVDQTDVTQFQNCASGPDILFNIASPPQGCTP